MNALILVFLLSSGALAQESGIEAPQSLPPKVIYQMGQKPFLLENAKFGNVPQEAWDKFIMGGESRYGLVPYRRGLYGGEDFDSLELYGNLYFGQPKVPWVMKIVLKEECRSASVSTGIFDDPRYSLWLIEHINEVLASAQECLNKSATDCGALLTGFQSIAYNNQENRCDAWLTRYLKDVGAKVVRDEGWEKSWYIRDRNCIENIEAAPKTVLETLAASKWDMDSRKRKHSGTAGYGASNFALLLGALADSSNANAALLKKIEAKTSASDIAGSFSVDTDLGKDFWVKDTVPKIISAYRNCREGGRLSAFQARARQFEAEVQKAGYDNGGQFIGYARKTVRELLEACDR